MPTAGGSFTPVSDARYAWRTTLFTLREYILFAIALVLILNIVGSLATALFPNRPHATEVSRRILSTVCRPRSKAAAGHDKMD